MFVYLRCDKKKKKNLANGIFFIISRVFFPWFFLLPRVFSSLKNRFLKDIRRGDNEHNIGSEIKKGLRSGLFLRFVVSSIFFFSSFFFFQFATLLTKHPFTYPPCSRHIYTDKRGKVKMDVTPYIFNIFSFTVHKVK